MLNRSLSENLIQEMIDFDRNHIWHPYTSAIAPLPVYPVQSAKGVTIELFDGRKLIDGMSSWWAAVHGYNHPELNEAATLQMQQMSHIMFGGITHAPAVNLAKKLIEIVPKGLEYVFYSDSGSVSVEVAMKMALQYQLAKGKKYRTKFVALRNAYHGDTFHAMSVCDPITGMHHLFTDSLHSQWFVSSPAVGFYETWRNDSIEDLKQILTENHTKIAALIIEPIVQGAGGMKFYHPQYLIDAQQLCQQYDILLIADEIATGFGRTGKLFACEHAGISPDIMCIGKALTGGYISFAATLCSHNIAHTISGAYPGVFMHGPTYMGNPLACAVALKSIEILLNSDWQKKVLEIQKHFENELAELNDLQEVEQVRCLGAIGVVEMKNSVNVGEIQRYFVDEGVWIRPFGKLVYLMPPFIITFAELKKLTDGLKSGLQKYLAKVQQ